MFGILIAAQLAVVVRAPDTVSACDAVEVAVSVTAGRSSSPRLVMPSLRPFDVLRGSASPRYTYDSRARTMTAVYRYVVTTDRPGRYTIPPFVVRAGGETAQSEPFVIAVRPIRARTAASVIARARVDTSGEPSLRSVAPPDTVFVGQQATYEVAVFLNATARDRLRRNPTFYPPEMQAMLAYDLPTASSRQHVGSQCFDALVYRRALFPLVAGRLVIPPAQLVYSTALTSSSLFSREESHELQTDSVTIVAVEPPAEGRPAEYSGAVGAVRLEARLDSADARVGDPTLLTVRVAGTGNVKLFPRPAVRVPWATLVAADERVRVDSTSARIGGVKEFDWVLTPRIAGEFDVPPVRYGYFDPWQRQYDVALTAGQRVRVANGALASADTGNVEAALRIRTRFAGTPWRPPQSRPEFWLLLALVPVPSLTSRLRRRAARRVARAADDPMQALDVASRLDDPPTLRRNYVRAIARRIGCSPEDFTHSGALERTLKRAGVSAETAKRAEALLQALDVAAYTKTGALPPHAARDAGTIARAVDREALVRTELPLVIPTLLLAALLGVAAAAFAADDAASRFARGVSAYVREDYPTARIAFADAVERAPTSPDAWANYGTAAWASGDTAGAVLGWRQALAIEPDAADVQSHMRVARDLAPSAPGWVPSLPRNAAVWLFAALWIAAWLMAWAATRPTWSQVHPWLTRLPIPLVACALAVGLGAIEIGSRTAGARLAVVRRTMPLYSDPAIGVDRGPGVAVGEIVRIAGRRGTWTRVEASDDRDGWIASSELLLVADRRPKRD